jgi:hypothetical protein
MPFLPIYTPIHNRNIERPAKKALLHSRDGGHTRIFISSKIEDDFRTAHIAARFFLLFSVLYFRSILPRKHQSQ